MLFWRQGCLLFLNWGKNLKYGESPPMEQSQEASRLGQKPEIWGIPPNGAVTGSKWVGVKQQKSGKYSKLEELHEA
jgi:hypothetical protein